MHRGRIQLVRLHTPEFLSVPTGPYHLLENVISPTSGYEA